MSLHLLVELLVYDTLLLSLFLFLAHLQAQKLQRHALLVHLRWLRLKGGVWKLFSRLLCRLMLVCLKSLLFSMLSIEQLSLLFEVLFLDFLHQP